MSGRKTFAEGKKDENSCHAAAKPWLFMSLAITWRADCVLNEHAPLREGAGKQNM